jgi:hypothetical protein
LEKPLHGRLVDKVQLGMPAGDQAFITLGPQPPEDGAPHHPAMPGNIYVFVSIHIDPIGVYSAR